MHICVSKLGHHHDFSLVHYQAIILTNTGLLLFVSLEKISQITIKLQQSSEKKINLQTPIAKYMPSCLGLNVFILHAGLCIWSD